jgi:hypothetical protein
MSFWNGYEWTSETSAPTAPPIPMGVGRVLVYLASLVIDSVFWIYFLRIVA